MTLIKSNIALRLKGIRKSQKLSQAEVADRTSFSRSTVANIENCTQRPSVEFLIEFAGIVNMSLDHVIGNGEEQKNSSNMIGSDLSFDELLAIIQYSESIEAVRAAAKVLATRYQDADRAYKKLNRQVKNFMTSVKSGK